MGRTSKIPDIYPNQPFMPIFLFPMMDPWDERYIYTYMKTH